VRNAAAEICHDDRKGDTGTMGGWTSALLRGSAEGVWEIHKNPRAFDEEMPFWAREKCKDAQNRPEESVYGGAKRPRGKKRYESSVGVVDGFPVGKAHLGGKGAHHGGNRNDVASRRSC